MKISRLNTISSREQLIALDVVRLSQDKHYAQIVYLYPGPHDLTR